MGKYKVPLTGGLFELANGRQLVPGEVAELSDDEAKDNADLLKKAVESGELFETEATPLVETQATVTAKKADKGGDK
jgi:hypothetical protein